MKLDLSLTVVYTNVIIKYTVCFSDTKTSLLVSYQATDTDVMKRTERLIREESGSE